MAVRGVDQENIHLFLDQVFHVIQLFGAVILGIGDDQLRSGLLGRLLRPLLQADEEGVVQGGDGKPDRHAVILTLFLLFQAGLAGTARDQTDDQHRRQQGKPYLFHLRIPPGFKLSPSHLRHSGIDPTAPPAGSRLPSPLAGRKRRHSTG